MGDPPGPLQGCEGSRGDEIGGGGEVFSAPQRDLRIRQPQSGDRKFQETGALAPRLDEYEMARGDGDGEHDTRQSSPRSEIVGQPVRGPHGSRSTQTVLDMPVAKPNQVAAGHQAEFRGALEQYPLERAQLCSLRGSEFHVEQGIKRKPRRVSRETPPGISGACGRPPSAQGPHPRWRFPRQRSPRPRHERPSVRRRSWVPAAPAVRCA
jgi:hypothetical protein